MLTALRLLMNWNVSVNTLTAAPVRQLPVTPQARFSHQPVLPPCLPRFALAERLQAPHQIRLPATHCLPVLLFYQVQYYFNICWFLYQAYLYTILKYII